MDSIGTPAQWGGFFALIFVLLALDLGVFHRKERPVTLRESVFWSIFWTLLAFAFNYWIYYRSGSKAGLEFLAGYVVERALSFDNIFVFIVVFNYFGVPAKLQHRVLFWGILGALASRGLFIYLGAELLQRFEWLIYLFGAFLVYTGIKVLREPDSEVHPEKNPVVRFARRFIPMTSEYHGKQFFVVENGKRLATPLFLVLLVVESTDIVFAVDSIPAIFGVTRDTFIIFTSNIFAILGLRALYFLLAALMKHFAYLSYGLGLVLVFIGAKMLGHHYVPISTGWSLGIVCGILAVSVTASLLWPPKNRPQRDTSEGPEESDEPGE